MGEKIPLPDDKLFISRDVYEYQFTFIKSIISFYLNDFKNGLVSCNKLFDATDIYGNQIIDTNKSINTLELLSSTTQKIVSNINTIVNDITNKKNALQTLLTNIITTRTFEKQQIDFITYNEFNTKQKQKHINTIENNIQETQKDINIKQLNLTNFVSSSSINDNKLSFYYKCIKYLLIIIILVIILNIIFSAL